MDRDFENAANLWLGQYKTDIQSKVKDFLDENEASPEELAEEINVDVEEIHDILDGNSEGISVNTLIRVFMTLGLAVEIKPIEETPLGGYDNVNPHVMREPQFMEERVPQPNVFNHPPMGIPRPPHNPFLCERVEPKPNLFNHPPMGMPRPPHNPFLRKGVEPKRESAPSSPFALMGREELVRIIKKHLWDSEIDTDNASNVALVRFLEDKDKRMKEVKRMEHDEREMRELENDPKVVNFINKMKDTCKKNPQFRSYVNRFMENLEKEN